MPELLLQQTLAGKKKIAELFLGINGMENAFNVLVHEFDSQNVYYAFGAAKGENVKQIQSFFTKLHQQRINKKVRSKIIFNESSRGLFQSQEKSTLVEKRYLFESTPAGIIIFKDYTIIAILNTPIPK